MSLKSCDQSLLAVRHMRLKTEGDRALAAVELWNSLPLSLRSADFMASFKKNIKTSLLFFHFLDSFLCTDEALCDVYLDKCDYYIFIAMLYFHFNTVSKNFIDIFVIIDYVF